MIINILALLRPIDSWYDQQAEPARSCLQFLRAHILKRDARLAEAWKYKMPFFCLNEKMVCYLWMHKKLQQPYIGFVDGKLLTHPDLLQEKRARMKILMIDPAEDLPLAMIDRIFDEVLAIRR